MRWRALGAAALTMVALAGCGGGSDKEAGAGGTSPATSRPASDTTTTAAATTTEPAASASELAAVNGSLVDVKGVDCGPGPSPYVADEDEIDLGENPVESMECNVDGRTIAFSAWTTADVRAASYPVALEFACSFGLSSIDYLAHGPWVAAADESTQADVVALDKVGEALNVTTTTKTC